MGDTCLNIKLKGMQDRRRKLTDEQKEAIKNEYAQGMIGQRPLAEKYGVSRSTIRVLVNPERDAYVKNRSKKHWRDYYDTKQHTEATRKLRKYKRELYLAGELNA